MRIYLPVLPKVETFKQSLLKVLRHDLAGLRYSFHLEPNLFQVFREDDVGAHRVNVQDIGRLS